jgi:hypothetical protein
MRILSKNTGIFNHRTSNTDFCFEIRILCPWFFLFSIFGLAGPALFPGVPGTGRQTAAPPLSGKGRRAVKTFI